MKAPTSYYGGKQNMIGEVLPLFPKHTLYCEPCIGGGALFFAKEPSQVEVINDLDKKVVNFYKTCVTDFNKLQKMIQATPHSRAMHMEAAEVLKNPTKHSDVKKAWAFWVQTNMSFASRIFGGYAYERKGIATTRKIVNKKKNFTKDIKERLDWVDIECNDALKVIKSRDMKDSFFYVDPPYYNSDMGHYKGYSLEDFTKLLECLSKVKGKFLLSSYPSEILTKFTKKYGWYTIKSKKQVSINKNAKSSKIKTEVLTANYDINKLSKKQSLNGFEGLENIEWDLGQKLTLLHLISKAIDLKPRLERSHLSSDNWYNR